MTRTQFIGLWMLLTPPCVSLLFCTGVMTRISTPTEIAVIFSIAIVTGLLTGFGTKLLLASPPQEPLPTSHIVPREQVMRQYESQKQATAKAMGLDSSEKQA